MKCASAIVRTGLIRLSFLLTFALLWIPVALAQSESNFAPVNLPRGVQLQIPKGWWLLGDDYNQIIQTTVEAALDLSGIGLQGGQETNLIAANSMPRSTYAAVRVDSTIPASIKVAMFSSITPADVRELQGEMRKNLQLMLPQQGLQLIELLDTRIEKISGYPALVTEYRRTGPKGPVWVQINQIVTDSQDIRINLSYRESEVALWKPVIGKIRQSISIARWP
jgi:hypothetical protein